MHSKLVRDVLDWICAVIVVSHLRFCIHLLGCHTNVELDTAFLELISNPVLRSNQEVRRLPHLCCLQSWPFHCAKRWVWQLVAHNARARCFGHGLVIDANVDSMVSWHEWREINFEGPVNVVYYIVLNWVVLRVCDDNFYFVSTMVNWITLVIFSFDVEVLWNVHLSLDVTLACYFGCLCSHLLWSCVDCKIEIVLDEVVF